MSSRTTFWSARGVWTGAAALLVALAASAGAAPTSGTSPPQLHVTLEPRTVTVGDRVTATLTVTTPDGPTLGEPRFPTWGETWGEAEVLEAGPPERIEGTGPRTPGNVAWRQRLVLAAFRTGEIRLPSRSILVPRQGRETETGPSTTSPRELPTGDGLSFTVASVLPADADPGTAEPAPAAPLRRLPAGETFWWTFGAALALLTGTLALLVARRAGTNTAPTPVDPLAELDERLTALEADTPAEEGHVALSRALRAYLGRRVGFPAPESTTTEVHRQLRDRRLPEEVLEPAARVLRACDRVKFAAECPRSDALAERVEAVRQLARQLEEHLRPAWDRTLHPAAEGSGEEAA